jgi:predicted permease
MNGVVSVLQTALPVFLALGLGMLSRTKGILTREGVDALKKVVMNFTLPFVLLEAFATAEYNASALLLPLVMFGVCCLALGLGYLAVRLFHIKGRLTKFLFTGFEAGILGYPLYALLFPGESLSAFALPDIGHTLFVFTLFKVLISGKTDVKAIVKDMATTPILWSVFAGVLIGATGFYGLLEQWGVAGILTAATSFAAAPTGMIILLTVGFDLVIREIPWKKTASLIAIRLGVVALCYVVIVALNRTVLEGIVFEGAMLLMLILPPPYAIPVFGDEPEERVQIASALSALTLVTIILFAVLSVIYGIR